jgi:hypothetical protein
MQQCTWTPLCIYMGRPVYIYTAYLTGVPGPRQSESPADKTDISQYSCIKLTFLSIKLTFLSIKLTFLGIKLTFLGCATEMDGRHRLPS